MSVGFETKGKVGGLWVHCFWERWSKKDSNKTEHALGPQPWGNFWPNNKCVLLFLITIPFGYVKHLNLFMGNFSKASTLSLSIMNT